MPYIEQWQRDAIEHSSYPPQGVGELTYVLYKACVEYLDGGELPKPLSFASFAEVIAALECAKQELYRRHVAPYEDRKIEANGDV